MVNGYDIGADDYITKPFSLIVLVSKVHAFMGMSPMRTCSPAISSS